MVITITHYSKSGPVVRNSIVGRLDRQPVFGREIAHMQGTRKFNTGVYYKYMRMLNFRSNAADG